MACKMQTMVRIKVELLRAFGRLPEMVRVGVNGIASYCSTQHEAYMARLDRIEQEKTEAMLFVEEVLAFHAETGPICSHQREKMRKGFDAYIRQTDRRYHDRLKARRTRKFRGEIRSHRQIARETFAIQPPDIRSEAMRELHEQFA